jgi:hypothetical protein
VIQEVFNDKYNTYMKENVRRRESVDVLSITSYLMDARVSKRISYIGTYIVAMNTMIVLAGHLQLSISRIP